jgi:hypothetical protein
MAAEDIKWVDIEGVGVGSLVYTNNSGMRLEFFKEKV